MHSAPSPSSIRAVIFDFDGLILETETPALEAWAAVYTRCALPFPRHRFIEQVGRAEHTFEPFTELLAAASHGLSEAELREVYRQHNRKLLASQAVLPGVKETLASAKRAGLRIGLASSSNRSWVAGHLERLGLLEYFELLRCRDDVAQGKPWPDLYLAVLKEFGLSGSQAVALEDSYNGVLAAKRAGLWCVAVPNPATAQQSFALADRVVPSLAHLPLAHLLAGLEANGLPSTPAQEVARPPHAPDSPI